MPLFEAAKPKVKEKKFEPWGTGMIEKALKERFAPPAFALLYQVRNGTGYRNVTRTADAIAVSLWPSRGVTIEGVEIKASRTDWLKELKDPAKADEINKRCHKWWLAVGDPSIVREGELPLNWGLLAPRGDKLVCVKEATVMEPEPLTLSFLASILRNVSEAYADRIKPDEIHEQLEKKFQQGIESGAYRSTHEITRYKESWEKLKAELDEFERLSGIQIRSYHGGLIGSALKAFLNENNLRGQLDEMLRRAEMLRAASLKAIIAFDSADGIDYHI